MYTRTELIHAADEYLQYCFAHKTPPHVNELAQRLGLRQDEFSRLFTRVVGEPPQRYLNRHRVKRAQLLLRRTDLPMAAIAERAGFGTTTTLFRNFRSMTGMTPRTYRLHKM